MEHEYLLERTQEHASAFLATLERGRVSPSISFEALRARLDHPLEPTGLPADEVIDTLISDTEGGLMASTGGRFFGWVIGGALPAAIAADWLAAVWDQNAAAPACSPAMAAIEEVCGKWLLDLLGLPASASFGFVTGCQAAHTTALMAARARLLSAHGWDVGRKGLSGAPQIRLVTSEDRHESLVRAARIVGLGSESIELVRCERSGGISLADLEKSLATGSEHPTIVCLNAGDLNTGAFDLFETAIPMAKARSAWVHIDGAFGLWTAASERHRHRVAGVELADSWAADGHKWLNVPFDSGFVFVADPSAHSAALSETTSYSVPLDGARNPMDWNPEWSRRARALPTYAALRSLGRGGVEALIDRTCEHAEQLVEMLGDLDGVEILAKPIINQGLVRFRDEAGDHDTRTDAVLAKLQEQGQAWFGGTTWRGKRAMRVSVCNWRTTDDDLKVAVDAVDRAIRSL